MNIGHLLMTIGEMMIGAGVFAGILCLAIYFYLGDDEWNLHECLMWHAMARS